MIFKTFDSDIDKISAKWGVFGKSFNEIGTAIVGRISDINKGFQATDDLLGAFGDTESIWKRLYPSKESIQSQMIDVDSIYPEIDDSVAQKILNDLQQQQKLITQTKGNWSDYFKNFQEGEKWQIDFVQNTDLQKASLDDVKKGYENARQAAIAHNAALKQQTLSAKAGKIALQGLAMVGNALASWAIGTVLDFAITKLSEFENKEEIAAEKAEALTSTFENFHKSISEGSEKIGELSEKYDELSKGVSSTGMNISLTDEEYSEYKDTISQLSEIMPNLTTLFNEQGEKIGFVGGKIEDATKKYQEYIKLQAQNYLNEGDEDGNTYGDILDDYKYSTESDTYGWSNAWRDTVGNLLEVLSLYDIVSGFQGTQGKINWGSEIFGAEAEFSVQEQLDTLEGLLNTSKDKWQDILRDSSVGDSKETNLVEDLLDVDVDKVEEMSDDKYNQLQEKLSQKIEGLQQTIEGKAREVTSGMSTMLLADEDYWKIDDKNVSNALSSIISALNSDALSELDIDLNDQLAIQTWISGIIDAVNSNDGNVSDTIKKLFTLDIEDLNPEEAKELVDKYISIIAKIFYGNGATEQQKDALKASFGFDSIDESFNAYEEKLKYFNKKKNEISKYYDKNGEVHTDEVEVYDSDRQKNLKDWANRLNVTSDELDILKEKGFSAKNTITELTDALKEMRNTSENSQSVSFENAWGDLDKESKEF